MEINDVSEKESPLYRFVSKPTRVAKCVYKKVRKAIPTSAKTPTVAAGQRRKTVDAIAISVVQLNIIKLSQFYYTW